MKNKLVILIALTTMSFWTFAQIKDDSKIQNSSQYENYWEIQIKFNLPELNPEAIQICWLEFDPIEEFNKTLNLDYLTESLKKAKDENEKTLKINVLNKVTWDNLFNVVKGSEMYLLTNKGMILSSASDCKQPKNKKWLVTKVFNLDGKPYCYAIPFDLDNGSKLEVTLNKANLISLTDLYNKIKK